MLSWLLLLAMQLTPAEEATLATGLADIRAMDEELTQIQENQTELAGSRREREAEIAVLKRRYPEIVLSSGATVSQIYKALYAARVARAAKVRPLARENLRVSQLASCRAAQRVQDMKTEIEDGGGLDKMNLQERLEWSKNMETITSDASKCPK
jgi:hypothetical protein